MSDEGHDATRRRLMGGVTTGVLAAAVVPAAAQTPGDRSNNAAPLPLTDPQKAYPQPPFPKQQQPWPGLASKMDPRPDHGETSYKGSGRLAGRKALITGGDSGIGRAAAIAYAREGADVAINYLPAEEPDAQEVVKLIRAAGRKAVALPGDIKDEAVLQSARRRCGARARRARHPRQQRRAAGVARVDPGHHHRAVRRDLPDERLRDVLDHEGGDPAA